MSIDIIGPLIAAAINLPLAVWALLTRARTPAHRVFALFGLSLVLWALGGQVPHPGEPATFWHRLAALGVALVPANFLCLALAAREAPERLGFKPLLLYVPAVILGLTSDMDFLATHPAPRAYHIGLYDSRLFDEHAFWVMTAAYMAVALYVGWKERQREGGRAWVFNQVLLPLLFGVAAVLAVSYVRNQQVPVVSVWVMTMSQYAMFLLLRSDLASLGRDLTRRAALAFLALVLGAGLLLVIGLSRMLAAERITQEFSFLLVVAFVALFVVYAALEPRIEAFLRRRSGKEEGPDEQA